MLDELAASEPISEDLIGHKLHTSHCQYSNVSTISRWDSQHITIATFRFVRRAFIGVSIPKLVSGLSVNSEYWAY